MADETQFTPSEMDGIRDAISNQLWDDYYVVFAACRGSHARGLANADSDYDAHAVVVNRQPERYVTGRQMSSSSFTIQPDECIEPEITNEIDCIVWDITKFIDEAANGDPNAIAAASAPFDFISPDRAWADELGALRAEIKHNVKPFDLIRHYRSKSESNYYKYLADDGTTDRRAKRWLFVTEGLFQSLYVQQNCEIPPQDAETLSLRTDAPMEAKDAFEGLIGAKRDVEEAETLVEPDEITFLNEWIQQRLDDEVTYEGYVDQDIDINALRDHAEQIAGICWNSNR